MSRISIGKISFLLLSLMILISLASPIFVQPVSAQTTDQEQAALKAQFQLALNSLDTGRVKDNVQFFSSVGSRVTGYPGFFQSVDYIVSKFKEYGIQPYGDNGTYFENYNVTVPVDHGATIALADGSVITGYNIWPNLVNPSPYTSPVTDDKLIYVKSGSFDDLNNKNLTGRFVLMDFDSRWFFRLAAMFGAKGIIYIGNEEASRMEAVQKLYLVPINLPRIYVSSDDGYRLRTLCMANGEIDINIRSFMEWRKILVPNILGYIPGTSKPNETAVISAYVDSWSIVPALAPGATDSLGLSVFMEVARFLSQNHPSRSVILLGLSGHWEGLWGAREFVDRYFNDIGKKIVFFAGMDLATGSGQLAVADLGTSYAYKNIEILNGRYSWLVSRFFQTYLPVMQDNSLLGPDYGTMFVDQILNTYPPWIRGSLPLEFSNLNAMFDSEPYVSACYGGGFTYRSVNDVRYYEKTPDDTFDKVNWDNLWPQAQFIIASLWGLLNEPSVQLTQTPNRMESTGEWGYCDLLIQVVQYNFTTAYWDAFDARRHPVENNNTLIHMVTSIVTTGAGAVTPILGVGVFGTPLLGSTGYLDVIALADEHGEVLIKGVKPYSGGIADAFVVNRTNGNIEWAMDLGAYSAPSTVAGGTRFFSITTTESYKMISVFRCGSIMMYSLFNPSDLSAIPGVMIYNHIAHGNLIWQSTIASYYGDLMVFVQTGIPVELMITRGSRFPLGILLNSTSDKALGYGYTIQPGETLTLTYTPMIYARNLYWLNDGRVQTAESYDTFNPTIVVFHGLAKTYLDKSTLDLAEGKIGLAYTDSYASWAYEQNAYQATMDLIWQVIYTTIFFSIALIPFALLVEQLSFGFEGVKRISTALVIFAAFMVLLGIFHPGFHLATNASIAIMAFGMMAIMIPSLAFIAGEASATAKSLREQLTGLHVAEISRSSAIIQAFSTGVQNMKKRRFRTILTLISLTLIVFAMVTFTSLASIPRPMVDNTSTPPLYQGIMLRKVSWLPIPEEMYYQVGVMSEENAIVSGRAWLFPPTPPRGLASFAFSPQLLTKIGGVLFVSPEEADITRINDTVVRGRWLLPEDMFVCLISETASDNLTKELGRPIREGSTLNFLGMNLKVVGVFDGKALWSGTTGILDLDGEAITPVIPIAMREGGVPAHFEGDRVMIMPFKLALQLRESIRGIESAAIKPLSNTSGIPDLAVALALRMQTNIFFSSQPNQTQVVRYRAWFSATGLTNLIIPAIIGGFTVLNMMLGAVHERMREISIYMAVGLSPLHVAGLFMSESVVHALLSAVLGYMTGIIGCWVFGTLHLYPQGFFPNYSSYFVLYVVGASAGVTIASSLYPALTASRLVTPSLERRWKIPKPSGREWEIPLPFVATENETYGIFAFIYEFLMTHAVEGVGLFATFGDVTTEEKRTPERDNKVLTASVRLAPFDVGITQRITVTASAPEGQRYTIVLYLTCLTGLLSDWINSNRPFIDNMRKQMLIWRALPPSHKDEYIAKGRAFQQKSEVA